DHVLDEKASGAKPSTEEARRIAENYLAREQGLPVPDYTLVESQQEKRENRVDHSFVWEATQPRVGQAKMRVSLEMVGDEPCHYRPYLKLPEEWVREFGKQRLTSYLPAALYGVFGIPLVAAFFWRLRARDQRFHWRVYGALALGSLVLAALSQANELPAWLVSYDTSVPLENFYGRLATSVAISILLTGAGGYLGALSLDTFRQAAVPSFSLPLASVLRAAAIAVLLGSLDSLLAWFWQLAPGMHLDWRTAAVPDLDLAIPALNAVADALLVSML